jgi:hypothetical protein
MSDIDLALALGVMRQEETTVVDFSGTATTSGLDDCSQYRLWSTEDCFVSMIDPRTESGVTTSGVPLSAGQDYLCSTDRNHTSISVIRRSNSGRLYVTKMQGRHGK